MLKVLPVRVVSCFFFNLFTKVLNRDHNDTLLTGITHTLSWRGSHRHSLDKDHTDTLVTGITQTLSWMGSHRHSLDGDPTDTLLRAIKQTFSTAISQTFPQLGSSVCVICIYIYTLIFEECIILTYHAHTKNHLTK